MIYIMKRWYLLVAKPREDERAQLHLESQGYEIFRPQVRKFAIKGGKQAPVLEPLFPRYLFIRLDKILSNWSRIRSTRGVSQLVRFAELPAVVPDQVLSTLRTQCSEDDIIDITGDDPFVFYPGDEIEITEGSFKGIRAMIKEQSGDDRVLLLLDLLGNTQELEMPIHQIKSTTLCDS